MKPFTVSLFVVVSLASLSSACGTHPVQVDRDAAGGDDDALIDAADPDASNDPARVEASSFDGPLAGVTVAILDASDGVVSTGTTAADGAFTGVVPVGGSVIAASPANDYVYMWRSVEAGDVLRARFDVASTTHDVTFILPNSGSGDYSVTTRCRRTDSAPNNNVTVALPVSCTASDVVAHYYSYSDNVDRAFQVTAQDLTASSIDLTAVPWADSPGYTLAVTNIPSSITQITSSTRIGELHIFGIMDTFSGTAPLGDRSYNARTLAVAGAQAVARFDFFPTIHDTFQSMVRRTATLPTTPIDATLRLVNLSNVVYASATRRLTWDQGSVGDPIDAARGTIVFERRGLPHLTWDILQPASAASAQSTTIPALPPELAGVDPGTTTSWTRDIGGYAIPGGYDRVRTTLFGLTRFYPDWLSDADMLLAQPGLLRYVGSGPI
ncbi:MAG TPA: hypothetical protein VGM90_20670 [Kofleriaceae bacterium]